jgi:hypothetical protein
MPAPWERYQSAGPVYGPPPAMKPFDQEDQQMQRDAAARAARSEARSDEASARAAQSAGRLGVSDTENIDKKISAFGLLLESAKNFEDDFSGAGSGIENFAQSYSPFPVGTEGQRNWWAEFREADNLVRNELFGASLSGGEKAAYGQTTVDPDMTPEEVRRNLRGRTERARAKLKRFVAGLDAAGYNPDQIDALLGEYGPLIRDDAAWAIEGLGKKQDGTKLPAAGVIGARGAGGAAPPQGGGTRVPEMIGDLPKGTEIEFGMDRWGSRESFDRNAALQEIYGITPNQEATIASFWNANSGNDGMTVEGVKDFYNSQGLPLPTDASIEEGIANAQAGLRFSTYDLSNEEAAYKAALDKVLEARGAEPETASGAIGPHAAQGLTIGLTDELAGVGGFLNSAFNGRNPVTGYQFERDVARRELERGAEKYPKASLGAEIVGSLATGKAGFGNVKTVGQAARAGARMGAVAGFNYGEGPVGSTVGAGVGALGGAAVGAGVQAASPYLAPLVERGVNALTPRRIAPDAAAQARSVLEAGERQGVPIRQPDIRPEVRGSLGVVEKTESGGPIIRETLQGDLDAMETAVARIGGDRAAPDRISAGSMAQDALDRQAANTSARGGTLYRRASRLAGDGKIVPNDAIAAIDREIADLTAAGANTNRGLITYLGELKDDLSKGLSIDNIRSLRTSMRGQINERNLGMTDAERRVSNVIASASGDIEKALEGNPGALQAYRNADRFWREKKDFEKQVSARLLGPENNRYGPEKTASALESMMKPGGDFRRFERWHKTLEPEERADWAASVAENLGRNAKGEFSLPIFLNNIGPKGTLSKRAAKLVFGEDGVKALDDLRVIGRAKMAAQTERNASGTSGAVNRAAGGFRTMMLSALGFASGDASGAVAGGTAGYLIDRIGSQRAARLLMNPDFTKWLRRLPESSDPQVIDRTFSRLETTAARSPVLAGDVLSLQNALRDAFAQSPMRAAAQGENENDSRSIPPQ